MWLEYIAKQMQELRLSEIEFLNVQQGNPRGRSFRSYSHRVFLAHTLSTVAKK